MSQLRTSLMTPGNESIKNVPDDSVKKVLLKSKGTVFMFF